MTDQTPPADNLPLWRAVLKGAQHVLCVAWTVPAVKSQVATVLVRLGLPTAFAAIVVAVADALGK